MNQISPKIFEAIAVRTALVLFEGEYSGVLTPDRHFKPLRKDLGNLDEVLAFLEDEDALRTMTTLAFDEVLLDDKWSYRSLAAMLDDLVDELAGSVPPRVPSAQRVPILLPTTETARHTSEPFTSSQDRNPVTDLLGRIPGRRLVPHGVRRRVLEWMRR
jgi:hypothetical protein